jgi:hypothetical protein
MATAIIQHRVENFRAWKPVYDAHEGRKQYSFQDRVLQTIDDPNNVIVILDSDNADKLRDFLQSDDLKAAMRAAGVVGEPTIWLCA